MKSNKKESSTLLFWHYINGIFSQLFNRSIYFAELEIIRCFERSKLDINFEMVYF